MQLSKCCNAPTRAIDNARYCNQCKSMVEYNGAPTSPASEGIEEILVNFYKDMASAGVEYESVKEVGDRYYQAIQRLIQQAEIKASLGMVEYYDQASDNKNCDWKGLFADNRKQLEYELDQLGGNDE